MKYRCDMVRDLMPLCLDHEASESSEQTVIEHMVECKECTKYYEALGKEMEPIGEQRDKENEYVKLASKIRKRKKITAVFITSFVWLFCFICLTYASGYRLSPKAAADLSGRLNDTSQVISCYEWEDDFHFYIYDSYSCYDVVYVEKSLLGWKKYDNNLNWPKWSAYEENVGIETAGALCHFKYDEGVQLFPVRVYDDKVKSIEVTCFEQTQTKEVTPGEVVLFTFDAVVGQSNKIEATAYDAKGNALYYLDERHIWEPVEE
ncbi:MAG: zf-HC2 domain-containing protein [Lachnospiraceae bacterium]|nr:zf-HC2 domain-containing protein [Lachnospiraceae bacterium]